MFERVKTALLLAGSVPYLRLCIRGLGVCSKLFSLMEVTATDH